MGFILYIEVIFVLSCFYVFPFIDGRKITIKDLKCSELSEDVCGDLKCSIQNKKTINLGCTLREPATELSFDVKLSFVNPKIKPFVVSASGDFCDVMSGNIDSYAMKIAMPLLKTFTPQFSHACPYKDRLELVDFNINDVMSMLPPISPTGDYLIGVKLRNQKNQTIIAINLASNIKV